MCICSGMSSDSTPPPPAKYPPNPVEVPVELLEGFAWQRLFDIERPIELEIGCGKGGFLLRRARDLPDRNFLGIEWANQIYKYAADRVRRWGLKNVRMLRTDAGFFMRQVCPRDSLTVLHVYHPDPWPKKRHHKRRLIQPSFVAAAADCLVRGGRWAIQTDHAEYFEQIRAVVLAHPGLKEVPFEDPGFGVTEVGIETNFENKYRREGRAFHRLAVVKP